MMRARAIPTLAVLFALYNSACTFYTGCPDTQQQNPPAGGDTGSGGKGNGGGASSVGGSDVISGGKPPAGEWLNETFNLTDLESECGNVSLLSTKPNDDMLIVSIAQNGLWSKASAGAEWLPLGQGVDSAVITNRGTAIVYDPFNSDTFWESGIYNASGVYRSDDAGKTFVDLTVTHNDYVSIDFTDPDRQTLLASGHEQNDKLYLSVDGGLAWEDIGASIPEGPQVCPHPLVLDASTFLLGCGSYGGGDVGVYRSTDAGGSWQQVSEQGSGAGPLVATDGTIYWMGEGTDGLVRSEDQGKTWQGPFGEGELGAATPVELPDGRLAALGQRRILVSEDAGERWQVVTSALSFQPTGLAYSAARRAFYVWHWTCEAAIPADAVLAYDFDFETE